MMGGITYQDRPPHPPDDNASSPALEWLERERRQKEPPAHIAASVGTSKGKVKTKLRVSNLVVFGVFVGSRFLLAPFVGRVVSVVIAVAVASIVHILSSYLHREYRAYRLRQRASQADALI